MKNRFHKFSGRIASAAVLFLCLGCVNMDLTPKDQGSASAVWSNATMAEQTLSGVYSVLYYSYEYGWDTWWDCWGSMMDIDANWLAGLGAFFGNNVSTNDRGCTRWWNGYYGGIFRANDVIENIPNVPDMDDSVKSRYISEARFLRCFWYYRLAALYGNIPFYTAPVTNPDDTKDAKQYTQDEMWELIAEDLTLCIEDPNLPDTYADGDSDYGHVTKAAAYALRGNVYMWQKEWQKAINDFQAVKNIGHELFYTSDGTSSYEQLFKLPNEHCKEMIFSLQCTDTDNGTSSQTKNQYYGSRCLPDNGTGVGLGWTNYLLNPHFVDSYENADGSPFNWDDYIPGYNEMTPAQRSVFFLRNDLTDSEYANFENNGADMSQYLGDGGGDYEKSNEARILKAYANRDPRLLVTIVTPYSTYIGGISGAPLDYTYRAPYRTLNAPTYDYATDITAMSYYTNRKFVGEGLDIITKYSAIDIPFIRYAQVLLWWAEALNELGKTGEAVELVNQVRARAGAQLLNSNEYTMVKGQDDMRERIMNEMHWELVAEDVVYFDELRWKTWKDLKFYTSADEGKTNGLTQWWGKVTYSYSWGGDNYWLLPIPANAVQIDHLKQNPGYN